MKKLKVTALSLTCLVLFLVDFILPAHAISKTEFKFIHHLLPTINQVNDTIWSNRQQLLMLHKRFIAQKTLSPEEKAWLKNLAARYKLTTLDFSHKNAWAKLIKRVDVVPASLALAQAAHESAWGSSRFAKTANNFFGQWCFKKGCGVIPERRPVGAHYEAQRFSSLRASVISYMRNLNTNAAYDKFRQLRYAQRERREVLEGYYLATGIAHYNPSRGKYVKLIQNTISKFDLGQYDNQTRHAS